MKSRAPHDLTNYGGEAMRLLLKSRRRPGIEPPMRSTARTTHNAAKHRGVGETRSLRSLLMAAKTRLAQAYESNTDAFVAVDGGWHITYANSAFEQLTERKRDTLVGRVFWEEFPDLVKTVFHEQAAKAMRERTSSVYEEFEPSRRRWLEVRLFPTDDGLATYIRDITDRKQAEQALRERGEQLQMALAATGTGIWTWDIRSGVIVSSDTMYHLFGVSKDQFTGSFMSFFGLIHPDDQQNVHEALRKVLEKPYASSILEAEFRVPQTDGSLRWIAVRGMLAAEEDAGPTMMRGTCLDITERKRSEEHINRISYRDALTDLPNRVLFSDRLEQAISGAGRTAARAALLFLDLDRFKEINDSLGHDTGDALLWTIARRLATCLRTEDTLARTGGDEFAALIPDLKHPELAAATAQKMLDCLVDPIVIDGREFFVSASIGISMFPNDGADSAALLRHAEIAMYRAKNTGHPDARGRTLIAGQGSYCHYSETMDATAANRLFLATGLRRALERDEFYLQYQPQATLAGWNPSAPEYRHAEALIRWKHPELGMVSPLQFIPLAEETGLIGVLGEWVLRTACAQAMAWHEAGKSMAVAVNISARQFDSADFVQSIQSILAETGLPASLLHLELTESVLMHDRADIIDSLHAIRALGVGLSVDDFGTGYSSLAYLRRFPLNTLKIDRMFIARSDQDDGDLAVVKSLIDLAHALGLDVVAEGVETEEQLRRLVHLGCDRVQGFLLHRPLNPSQIDALLGIEA